MLGDRGGDQAPPPHPWEGGLVIDILQEAWPEYCITYHRARDVRFALGGPFNWARRSAQIEASRKTMQEGHCTILEDVVEKKMKARGPG